MHLPKHQAHQKMLLWHTSSGTDSKELENLTSLMIQLSNFYLVFLMVFRFCPTNILSYFTFL